MTPQRRDDEDTKPQHVTVDKVTGAVPVAWLLTALWAVTMTLAGWWATTMQNSVQALAAAHSLTERETAAYQVRLEAIERNEAHHVRAPEMADVKERLNRIERKLDEALDRQDSAARARR